MKKILLLFMLIPFLGMGQTKNVINTSRLFAKQDKNAEFEKALAAHAQKYHSGNWKWRVFEIQTGPDAGGYHIVEGPLTWDDFDKRNDLSAEHTADWNKNVAPLTTGQGGQNFSTFDEELSTVAISDYSDKIVVIHMYPKPGMINNANEMLKKLKKAWEAGNEKIAVYRPAFSGEPQIVTVSRLKEGLKELDSSFRKPMAERFNAANGEGSWDAFQVEYSKNIDRRWAEMLFYRADLSSK